MRFSLNSKYIIFTFFFALSLCIVKGYAMPVCEPTGNDESDEEIRLNPVLGFPVGNISESTSYPFIRYDLNYIEFNGDDWQELANKLEQSRKNANFTILHIGDSHIQADGNTGTTRKQFQDEYGCPGRGIIIPFKIAGTNQPVDYQILSQSAFTKATIMRQPWATRPGFTGVSLHPLESSFAFEIKLAPSQKCSYFTVLGEGDLEIEKIISGVRTINFESEKDEGGIQVWLDDEYSSFTIHMSGEDVNIYGFDLRNDASGVIYHAIGNNGAAYSSYNALPSFAKSLKILDADLIIISLGTNEAFGTFNEQNFRTQIDKLVTNIKKYNPESKILLTTPSECQRSTFTRTRKSRRQKSRRVKTYMVNNNVSRVRRIIAEYGREHGVPVYDFYAIAGGDGASERWLAKGLLSNDRIHRTWAGYRLDGTLLYYALREALMQKSK